MADRRARQHLLVLAVDVGRQEPVVALDHVDHHVVAAEPVQTAELLAARQAGLLGVDLQLQLIEALLRFDLCIAAQRVDELLLLGEVALQLGQPLRGVAAIGHLAGGAALLTVWCRRSSGVERIGRARAGRCRRRSHGSSLFPASPTAACCRATRPWRRRCAPRPRGRLRRRLREPSWRSLAGPRSAAPAPARRRRCAMRIGMQMFGSWSGPPYSRSRSLAQPRHHAAARGFDTVAAEQRKSGL